MRDLATDALAAPYGAVTASLTEKFPFAKVLKEGGRLSATQFSIRFLWRADRLPARTAFVVSKKIGGAIARNRNKRRLREIIRKAGPLPEGLDLLVLAHPRICAVTFQELEASVVKCLGKIGDIKQG